MIVVQAGPVRWSRNLADAPHEGTTAWLATEAEAEAQFGSSLAPTGEDHRDIGLRRGADAVRFLRRRSTLRHLVARCFGVSPTAVVIGYGEAGRPSILSPDVGWFCSVAARGALSVFALSADPVGIDFEPVIEGDIPWAVLTQAELVTLRSLRPQARRAAFFDLWTVKEAYLKACGSGLLHDPAAVDVADPALLIDGPKRVRLTSSIRLRSFVDGQCVVAACIALSAAP